MTKVSMPYLFFFSRYQTKRVMKFLFRQLRRHKFLRFILGQGLKQWLTGREKGEDENTEI